MLPPSSDIYPYLLTGAIGMAAGAMILLKAWLDWKRSNSERSPLLAISQALSGMARVRGVTRAPTLLNSPLNGAPCCAWRAVVQPMGNSRNTIPLRFTSREHFWLSDATGTLEISPHTAMWIELPCTNFELDLMVSGNVEAGERLMDDSARARLVLRNADPAAKSWKREPFPFKASVAIGIIFLAVGVWSALHTDIFACTAASVAIGLSCALVLGHPDEET